MSTIKKLEKFLYDEKDAFWLCKDEGKVYCQSVHGRAYDRKNKAKEQAKKPTVKVKVIAEKIITFLNDIGIETTKKPVLEIPDKADEKFYTKRYKDIEEEFKLEDKGDLVWLKFTKDDYLGVVAKGADINFSMPTSKDEYDKKYWYQYYNPKDNEWEWRWKWEYATSGIITHHLEKEWNESFVLLFPLKNIPDGYTAFDIERAIGNYLIKQGVPILDYYSHMYEKKRNDEEAKEIKARFEGKAFDLPDLDEDFWSKVVFFEVIHSSGLGGPGSLWLVTDDKKAFYFSFEGAPFNERSLEKDLHPMFAKSDELTNGRFPYIVEKNGWRTLEDRENYLLAGEALIRDYLYEKIPKENSSKEIDSFGYLNTLDLVRRALDAESLERVDYVRSIRAHVKRKEMQKELEEAHERKKLLPKHLTWKPMHLNNRAENSIVGEYALIVNKTDGKITARRLSIVFQYHADNSLRIYPNEPVECYCLFLKDYVNFYGPSEYPSSRNLEISKNESTGRSSRESAFFNWMSLGDNEIHDYGRFIRCFKNIDDAKEYGLNLINANGGNRFTLIDKIGRFEDHQNRIEHYEAYQMFRKYYKKILDIIINFDDYPDEISGGGGFLINAILREIPELSRKQLMLFWDDVPLVLEKRTQEEIEKERLKSLSIIKDSKRETC